MIKRTNKQYLFVLILTLIAFSLMLFNLQSTNQSLNHWTGNRPIKLIDPLPSCSIINQHLTINLLNHALMIQKRHNEANCSMYATQRRCLSNDQSFRPRWLVYRFVQGTGGFADRMKGLLTLLTLALLTNRAFAIEIDQPGNDQTQPINLALSHRQGVMKWVWAHDVDAIIRQTPHQRHLFWIDDEKSPLKRFDWSIDCSDDCLNGRSNDCPIDCYDLLIVTYNLPGFVDLLYDHPNRPSLNQTINQLTNQPMSNRWRMFGFHALTEKGDLDLYYDCLQQHMFTYTEPVLTSLNQLLRSINRPVIQPFDQSLVPTIDQLADMQSKQQLIRFYTHPPINQPIMRDPLFCLQLRMGKNAHFTQAINQATNSTINQAIGFSDSEAFLSNQVFTHVFGQMDAIIQTASKQFINQPLNLLITSDSLEFEDYLPQRWREPGTQNIKRMIIPGFVGHIDKLRAVDQADTPLSKQAVKQSAWINTVITYHLLGECDYAAVSEAGFGTSAMWRTRNSEILRSINPAIDHTSDLVLSVANKHVLTEATFPNKYLINRTTGDYYEYRHSRGSGGRELVHEYQPVDPAVKQAVEQSTRGLISQSVWDALRPVDRFQAGSKLSVDLPDDPMCTQLKFSYD